MLAGADPKEVLAGAMKAAGLDEVAASTEANGLGRLTRVTAQGTNRRLRAAGVTFWFELELPLTMSPLTIEREIQAELKADYERIPCTCRHPEGGQLGQPERLWRRRDCPRHAYLWHCDERPEPYA